MDFMSQAQAQQYDMVLLWLVWESSVRWCWLWLRWYLMCWYFRFFGTPPYFCRDSKGIPVRTQGTHGQEAEVQGYPVLEE
jgi:hypothetical protein